MIKRFTVFLSCALLASAVSTAQNSTPEVVIQAFEIKDASPMYGNCTISLVSTDGNDSNAERVTIKCHGEDMGMLQQETYATISEMESLVIYKNGYGLTGKGVCIRYDDNGYGDAHRSTKDKVTIEISDTFYNLLYRSFCSQGLPCYDKREEIHVFD